MEAIYLLIPLSLLLVIAAIIAFFWAVNSGQFEDLDSRALDIFDEPLSKQSRSQEEAEQ